MNSPEKTPTNVDIIILTAISLEYKAVCQVDEGAWPVNQWSEIKDSDTGLPISFRRFQGKQNLPLQVAVAQAGGMGATAATTTLVPLISKYNPSCVAMAGVCAGRQDKTQLGDVIAAERLFFHDTGKQFDKKVQKDIETYNLRRDWKVEIERFDFQERFQAAEWFKQRPIPYEWQQNWVLAKLKANSSPPWKDPQCKDFCPQWNKVFQQLYNSDYVKIEEDILLITDVGRSYINPILMQNKQEIPDLSPFGDTLPFKVHVAPMSSGNQVIEDERIWGYISNHMRKTLGIDMEAAVVGAIAEAFVNRKLDVLVMKGVMDFANHGRDDHFKEFAARAAAECLITFLRHQVNPKPISEEGIDALGKPISKAPILAKTPRVVPVLEVPRPPPEPKSQPDQSPLPPAQLANIATLLGSLDPDENIFQRACKDAGLSHNLFWAASSPSDRWFNAICTASEYGILDRFLEIVVSYLPSTLRWRVRLIAPGQNPLSSQDEVEQRHNSPAPNIMLRALRWDRNRLHEYRMSLGQKEGQDIVGLRALRRVWGEGSPDLSALRQYLDEPEEDLISHSNESSNPTSSCSDLEENDFGLAAEHFWYWCENCGGNQLLEWLAQNADSLSPSRFAVIAAALHWWGDGRNKLWETAQKMVDQALDRPRLYPRSINAAVKKLSALDRLLCETGTTRLSPTDLPSSVRLAVGVGRLSSIARLLEVAGERHSAVFIEQIAECADNREAVVALARALRRLCIAGVEGQPRDPDLRAALRCSLPAATDNEIEELLREPQQRAWWLDLVAPPLSRAQIGGLIKIHGNPLVPRSEHDRARRWLCTTNAPLSVWKQLTAEQRRQWIEL